MPERDIIMTVRISAKEQQRIRKQMEDLGIRSLSAYLRKMALDGYCVRLDLSGIKELVTLLRRCSNNLNQYAKKANENGSIYQRDITDLKLRLEELWKMSQKLMLYLSSIH